MNVHEAIKVLLAVSGIGAYTFHPAEWRVTIIAAQSVAAEIISKYDALAPDWASAPDDARWYTIDANGQATWSQAEPFIPNAGAYPDTFWDADGEYYVVQSVVILPLGIDWRLCKWSREGAK